MTEEIRRLDATHARALLPELERLFSQLSANTTKLDPVQIDAAIRSPAVMVLGVFEDDELAGMGTVVVTPRLSKTVALIEDLVVAEHHRGRGVGTRLLKALIDAARSSGAETCGLTSSPERIVANEMYQGMGFTLRETNVYRYALTDP